MQETIHKLSREAARQLARSLPQDTQNPPVSGFTVLVAPPHLVGIAEKSGDPILTSDARRLVGGNHQGDLGATVTNMDHRCARLGEPH